MINPLFFNGCERLYDFAIICLNKKLRMQNKITSLKLLFADCKTKDAVYEKIMDLGKKLGTLDPIHRKAENLVAGCQSIMYLNSYSHEGKVYFEAESNALISAGLAYLMISVYSGETAETILTQPPQFLEEMGIYSSLSLNRSNGLSQLFLKMRKESLKHLTKS
jgi:cysteine desulfuration protein SufE